VVTATRTEAAPENVPATVSVITSQVIDENLVTNIKDLVQFEPGVAVRTNPPRFTAAGAATGRDGNSGFNIRGLEGNRVLTVVDGVRLPDAFSFGAQSVGRGDYADVSLLKSVEILRGPGSALYGSDGLAGIVSFTTKDPLDFLKGEKSTYIEANTSYDSADENWAKGALGAFKAGNWSFLASFQRRDGHEQETKGTNTSANTDRTAAIPQDTESNAGLAKLVFTPSEENRFRLTYDHFNSATGSNVLSAIAKPPLAATSTLSLLARDTLRRDRIMLDHKFEGELGFIHEASWSIYYQDSATVQYSAEDRNTAVDRTRLNTFNNRIIGLTAQLGSFAQTGDVSHHFVYGGDVSFTRQSGVRDGTVPPVGETFPTRAFPTTNYTLGGVYIQDEIGVFNDRLTLYPALRLDYYDLKPKADALLPGFTPSPQSDTHVSPKVGAVFKVTEEVRLFANYARGFKAPAPSQVNNFFANQVQFYMSLPNSNLRPETSEGIDGGIRFNNERIAAEVSGFYSRYRNFIDQIQVSGTFTPTNPGIFQYQNVGTAKISGIEGKLKVEVGAGFAVNGALSYAHGDTTTGGVTSPLNTVEPFKIVGGLNYRDPSGLFGGQFVATHSAGKSASRVMQTCTPSCFTPPGFTVLDLTAFWNVTEWATVRAGVFNLTDKKYWWWSDVRGVASTSTVVDAYTQPGRNVRASLTVKF
jgi:hemoglobin/transferrin/lactoferrin receptor protein